jgi:Ger(x)C family germination protein
MRNRLILILLISSTLLSGCWDQQLLVNKTLINGISFDLTEENDVEGTVRALNIQSKGGGQFEIADELIGAKRPTVSGLGIDIDNKLAGRIDASKSHIILIGDELAEKGINPFIEFFYRNKGSYMSSKIVITKGKAKDILSMEKEKSPIAFVILQTLKGAETDTIIPNQNAFTVWQKLFDPGKDMILPYLKGVEGNKIEVDGVALFNGDRYTGKTIKNEKSTLLLLLLNQLQKTSRMSLVLEPETKDRAISFSTKHLKRNFEVKVDPSNNQITAKVHIKMDIEVGSYPQDFNKSLNIEKLNKDLSDELTKQAKEITHTLIQVNCDALGIGRRLSSFHPELWKKINWNQEYKNVQIEPKVTVNIVETGNVY